jgi:hypothetical protein
MNNKNPTWRSGDRRAEVDEKEDLWETEGGRKKKTLKTEGERRAMIVDVQCARSSPLRVCHNSSLNQGFLFPQLRCSQGDQFSSLKQNSWKFAS